MINLSKINLELLTARLPIIGVSHGETGGDQNAVIMEGFGRFDFSRELTDDERRILATVVQAHDPAPSVDEKRQAEYDRRGATKDALTVALWESVVENRPEKLQQLQAIREQVKAEIPASAAEASVDDVAQKGNAS